ncbi:nitroreductase family protein [Desulfofustis glycolicus]|uniref:Nitroreductase n=1 Tax=Desulfofustis glycolicus DSM 9705 TaxID=1121409 RepID=A0A1M5TKY3_9BACT|nr:nitroreductase family protein [Desulfofustis glycolicus]MCB2216452.1 nitroreductase family protein [Desulfobulbaceae bacterium]SHH51023.1 Nitroreductase [Desulfofustis glycolicus DSM 9705]
MFIDLLRSRRSIRQFEKRPVDQEKIDMLIEAALRAPTSRGLNPWEFIFVTEPDTLEKLAGAKAHGSSFVKNGALAVVVCAHPEKSDVWVEDTAIASIILHLAAADLGLGSCWVQIRKRDHDDQTTAEDYVKNLLCLDPSLVVEAVIAIGYPAETKGGHDRTKLLDERISFERYGEKR